MYQNNSISQAMQAVQASGDLFIAQFLKDQIDHLSSRDTCWYESGIKGLVTLLRANVSQSPALGVNISHGLFNISAKGNNFSIDLASHTFEINALTESTYNTLTAVHRK